MEHLAAIALVFLIALLSSLLGLGGAILYVPTFYWLGMDIRSVVPLSLLLNAATSLSASRIFLQKGMVELRTAAPLLAASLAGAPAGAYIMTLVDAGTVVLVFSVMLLIGGVRMIVLGELPRVIGESSRLWYFLFFGFLAGVMAGLTGLGGGTYFVPLLMLSGLDTKKASATSMVLVMFVSIVGFASHAGSFSFEPVFIVYAAGAFAGALAGSRVVFDRIPAAAIRKAFGVLLSAVALKLFF
ncbi:MAG TPA: sulfite exporter TauE/SafE family protein [Candidatus Methanoperedenaceae archaeon]|nr:sulfite exporter TauE/SafE family protein [Candidatus Methanoperedenaceae archaeon]